MIEGRSKNCPPTFSRAVNEEKLRDIGVLSSLIPLTPSAFPPRNHREINGDVRNALPFLDLERVRI